MCGMVWYGMVWYGMVWYGMVWYGMVWYGMVWYGMVWCGMVWYGMVWYGMVWYGMVWYGMVWYGLINSGKNQVTVLLPSLQTSIVLLALTTASLILTANPLLQNLSTNFSVADHSRYESNDSSIDWLTKRFLDEYLPVRPPPSLQKWNICVCAMIHNEAAYLAEWIEFHRLQGVDHFVLYDYRSNDLILYLPIFYQDNGIRDLIEIIPAKFLPRE
jgi:hypothetical protein